MAPEARAVRVEEVDRAEPWTAATKAMPSAKAAVRARVETRAEAAARRVEVVQLALGRN
jgi:hypothetical protein